MLRFRKPASEAIRRYVEAQSALEFTYAAIGATANTPPVGFVVDHTRVELGKGEIVFSSARSAFQRWQQFELGWLKARPADTPIREGQTVAVLVRAFGLWWLNAARIVYVVDESTGAFTRFGFAYGTLPGHVEAGEERFFIEWDRTDDSVWYDILAFSRPRHFLTRLGKRRVRQMQKRFGQDSAAAMLRAVQTGYSSE